MIIEEQSNNDQSTKDNDQQIGQKLKEIKTDQGENNPSRNIITLDNEEIVLPAKHKNQLNLSNKKNQKPISPYIIFLKNYKSKYKDVNFKDLGKIWREMALDERQIYYELSQSEAQKLRETQQNNDEQIYYREEESLIENEKDTEFQFPLSRIKGIIKQDEENKVIKKSNLVLIEQIVVLFISLIKIQFSPQQIFGKQLLKASQQNMQDSKRKTLMKSDLFNALLTDKRFAFLASTGILKELGEDKSGQKSKIKSKQKDTTEKKQRKNSLPEVEKKEKQKQKPTSLKNVPKNNQKIDSFFKKI